MKIYVLIVLFFLCVPAWGQDFNEQFYYEYQSNSYRDHTGNLVSVNDTLAYIRFDGPTMTDNAFFACKYQFDNDTLILKEIQNSVDFNKRAEYSNATSRSFSDNFKDSVYLGYQVYYESGGQPVYDRLSFEIEGQKYDHNNQCSAYCTVMPRPKNEKFEIRIWNGQILLDEFQISLQQGVNVIRMTKDIFSSSGCVFLGDDLDELIKKIPEKIEIDSQEYTLIVELEERQFIYLNDKIRIVRRAQRFN